MSGPGSGVLPYGRQSIDEDDIEAVVRVLRSDWLTTGPAVRSFEEAFAAAVGARYAVSCSSGTAGLHLAALALGLGPETSVAVPTNTFVATANAARYVGAQVRFTDIDPQAGLMRPGDLERALDRPGLPATAVSPVHFAGQTVDMEAVAEIAERRGLAVIEDACHALGSVYHTQAGEAVPVGSCRHSVMTVFSMHPVKTITMGEGGVVTTNDPALHRKLLQFRSHGIVRQDEGFIAADLALDDAGNANPWYYELSQLGFNYRASDINCALGESQLRKLDRFVARRLALAERYDGLLAPLGPVVRPLRKAAGCRPGLHLYVVLIDFAAIGMSRAELMGRLREQGIGTQVHYIPVHRQPLYRDCGLHLPGSERYYRQCLTLPLHVGMSDEEVDAVVAALRVAAGGS